MIDRTARPRRLSRARAAGPGRGPRLGRRDDRGGDRRPSARAIGRLVARRRPGAGGPGRRARGVPAARPGVTVSRRGSRRRLVRGRQPCWPKSQGLAAAAADGGAHGAQLPPPPVGHRDADAADSWTRRTGRWQVVDTRKTLPLLRALEKYAVRVGRRRERPARRSTMGSSSSAIMCASPAGSRRPCERAHERAPGRARPGRGRVGWRRRTRPLEAGAAVVLLPGDSARRNSSATSSSGARGRVRSRCRACSTSPNERRLAACRRRLSSSMGCLTYAAPAVGHQL